MKAQKCDGLVTLAVLLTVAIGSGKAYGQDRPQIVLSPFNLAPTELRANEHMLVLGQGLHKGSRVLYKRRGASDQPGQLPIVSAGRDAEALIVRAPATIRRDAGYEVWVDSGPAGRSSTMLVNEPRPLWFSPSRIVHGRQNVTGPAEIRIIGRNLPPGANLANPVVKLLGPAVVFLSAARITAPEAAWSRFVLRAKLPQSIRAGQYEVLVRGSLGDWIGIPNQRLIVEPHVALAQFVWSELAGKLCSAKKHHDDSVCLQSVLHEVSRHGGGTLLLGEEPLIIGADTGSKDWHEQGIVVPKGVSLRGLGAGAGFLWRPVASGAPNQPAMTVLGDNTLSSLDFRASTDLANADGLGAFVMLGKSMFRALIKGSEELGAVRNIEISRNRFVGARYSIVDSGRPVVNLAIRDNEFRAGATALQLGGNRYITASRYVIEDSVIAGNVFYPGNSAPIGEFSPIASEIGAASRLDFRDNVADGSIAAARKSSAGLSGWRAGFFWHLTRNAEMLLIAGNRIICPGDRAGDGEAIALDNNANTFGFRGLARVVDAADDLVTVRDSLQMRQHDRAVISPSYYVGHWLRIADGPGAGQSRRIVGVTVSPDSGLTRFRIERAWDVAPVAGDSRISVARQFWQTLILGNIVEQQQPICRKTNPAGPKGGAIALWAQASDIVIAHNRQFDTDGIVFHQVFSVKDKHCADCADSDNLLAAVEISENEIVGEYSAGDRCSESGIRASIGSTPSPDFKPPALSIGVRVVRNRVSRADSSQGTAISFPLTWFGGPVPGPWPLVRFPIVEENRISLPIGTFTRGACSGTPATRAALPGSVKWLQNAVFSRNDCNNCR